MVVAGMLVLAALMLLAPGAAAKKKSGGTKPFSKSILVGQAVPDATGATVRSVPLRSTITVPKKYKGKYVGDVNVTGLQTTGSGAGAANDLIGYLISPGKRTFQLFYQVGNDSLGPWTIDDDTPVSICPSLTPCTNPLQSLGFPFAGTSNANFNWIGTFPVNGQLAMFDGVPMNGAWTLLLTDATTGAGNGTSTLDGWGLKITPAKRVSK